MIRSGAQELQPLAALFHNLLLNIELGAPGPNSRTGGASFTGTRLNSATAVAGSLPAFAPSREMSGRISPTTGWRIWSSSHA